MNYFYITDPGKVRERNEDSVLITSNDKGEYLLVVADGMGGHKAGEYASRYTVERIVAHVSRSRFANPIRVLSEAIQKANGLSGEPMSDQMLLIPVV